MRETILYSRKGNKAFVTSKIAINIDNTMR